MLPFNGTGRKVTSSVDDLTHFERDAPRQPEALQYGSPVVRVWLLESATGSQLAALDRDITKDLAARTQITYAHNTYTITVPAAITNGNIGICHVGLNNTASRAEFVAIAYADSSSSAHEVRARIKNIVISDSDHGIIFPLYYDIRVENITRADRYSLANQQRVRVVYCIIFANHCDYALGVKKTCSLAGCGYIVIHRDDYHCILNVTNVLTPLAKAELSCVETQKRRSSMNTLSMFAVVMYGGPQV